MAMKFIYFAVALLCAPDTFGLAVEQSERHGGDHHANVSAKASKHKMLKRRQASKGRQMNSTAAYEAHSAKHLQSMKEAAAKARAKSLERVKREGDREQMRQLQHETRMQMRQDGSSLIDDSVRPFHEKKHHKHSAHVPQKFVITNRTAHHKEHKSHRVHHKYELRHERETEHERRHESMDEHDAMKHHTQHTHDDAVRASNHKKAMRQKHAKAGGATPAHQKRKVTAKKEAAKEKRSALLAERADSRAPRREKMHSHASRTQRHESRSASQHKAEVDHEYRTKRAEANKQRRTSMLNLGPMKRMYKGHTHAHHAATPVRSHKASSLLESRRPQVAQFQHVNAGNHSSDVEKRAALHKKNKYKKRIASMKSGEFEARGHSKHHDRLHGKTRAEHRLAKKMNRHKEHELSHEAERKQKHQAEHKAADHLTTNAASEHKTPEHKTLLHKAAEKRTAEVKK